MNVAIVDNHPVTRVGLRHLLSGLRDLQIIADTGDCNEALRLTAGVRTDLMVLGLNPGMEEETLRACQRIKSLPEAPRVIVHSTHNFSDGVSSCLLASVDGYIHKSIGREEFLNAVQRCAGGERIWRLGAKISGTLIHASAVPGKSRLTAREYEILTLMLIRCPNVEMAEKLNVSLSTVKSHVKSVLRKLGLKSRLELC